jgi:hypothetical protein
VTEEPQQRPLDDSGPPEAVRFEATVHPGAAGAAALPRVADLDLDRVPDPEGEIRVLVTADDLERLRRQGFEVRVHREMPVRPLDPRLIADDADVRAWFSDQVRGTGEAGTD